MEAPITFAVLYETVSFLIGLSAIARIIFGTLGKIIFIDKIISRIIGRVNINHLHLAEIGFLQQFQGIQIVPFDIDILAIYPPQFFHHGLPIFLFGIARSWQWVHWQEAWPFSCPAR